MVTGAARATINRLPVLLLPGDIFATRVSSPVLQELELPSTYDVSVNDAFRPVSRFFDRVWRPEQLPAAMLGAKIGRASCRERVCQYVEISVVAVALTTKITNQRCNTTTKA